MALAVEVGCPTRATQIVVLALTKQAIKFWRGEWSYFGGIVAT